ncbi:MAG: 3-dehydroquinate synthase [Alphaproteobacteria bacterium]
MVETIEVGLGERTYPIHIGAGVLDGLATEWADRLKPRRLSIIADQAVWDAHGARLAAKLDAADIAVRLVTVPGGEETKSFPVFADVCEQMLAYGIERRDVLLAFGGGVVGDLAGYVAASLLRGIDFIQVPTTLLAQVDSSVGGKTGINSRSGKNLVGAFHQPKAVYIDTTILDTLPEREWRAGYAEVAKYGCLWDGAFFEWLESDGPAVQPGKGEALIEAITRSCAIKAEVVARDERESGVRGLLNLGHTFGHALEAIYGYDGRLLHGEGVSVGIGLAYALGRELGLSSGQDEQRVKAHLRAAGLPVDRADLALEDLSVEAIWKPMMKDKKVQDGVPTFIVPTSIGNTHLNKDVPKAAVDKVLNDWLET